jgi:hypothetical protein
MGVTLRLPHNHYPIISNNGAEKMALSVGRFADLGMGNVPKRHSNSVCMHVSKCPTF